MLRELYSIVLYQHSPKELVSFLFFLLLLLFLLFRLILSGHLLFEFYIISEGKEKSQLSDLNV